MLLRLVQALLSGACVWTPVLTYWTRVSCYGWWKLKPGWVNKTNLLQAIRYFMPLSETEYNAGCQEEYSCTCQDIMMFASYMRCVRTMSKTACPAKLLNASLTPRERRETQVAWMLHCIQGRYLSFSWTERHTVHQKPWTLNWNSMMYAS